MGSEMCIRDRADCSVLECALDSAGLIRAPANARKAPCQYNTLFLQIEGLSLTVLLSHFVKGGADDVG